MSRIEFMRELESLLSDIPLEERNDAIKYYNDYFDDAGEEHEEEIIRELGSPAKVAGIIKADLNLSGEELEKRGYFTEKGYQDTVYRDEKFEIIHTAKPSEEDNVNQGPKPGQGESNAQSFTDQGSANSNGQTGNHQGNKGATGTGQTGRNSTNIGLLVLIAIFAIPVVIPLAAGLFGIVVGILAAVFGLVVGFGGAGVLMIAAGVALIVIGIAQIGIPFALLALCGTGLVVFGLGSLFLLAGITIGKKLFPAIIRGVVNLCSLPFKNRSVAV